MIIFVINIFRVITIEMNNSNILTVGLVRLLMIKRLFVIYHLHQRLVAAVANPKCTALAVSIAASPAAPGVNTPLRHLAHSTIPPPPPPPRIIIVV